LQQRIDWLEKRIAEIDGEPKNGHSRDHPESRVICVQSSRR
jgi:hypothetical protein